MEPTRQEYFGWPFSEQCFAWSVTKRSKFLIHFLMIVGRRQRWLLLKLSSKWQKHARCSWVMQIWHHKIYQMNKHRKHNTRQEINVVPLTLMRPYNWWIQCNSVKQLLPICRAGGKTTSTSAASWAPRTIKNTRQDWNGQDACNLFRFKLLSPVDNVRDIFRFVSNFYNLSTGVKMGGKMLSRVVILTISVQLPTSSLNEADQQSYVLPINWQYSTCIKGHGKSVVAMPVRNSIYSVLNNQHRIESRSRLEYHIPSSRCVYTSNSRG